VERIVTDTIRLRDLDGGRIGSGRYIWRGPSTVPVFAIENSREIIVENVDVVCEEECASVFLVERTKSGPGVTPSTMHQFRNVRIFGNNGPVRGYWFRATIDENNEHGRWDACSVYGCDGAAWIFEGQQSKEHLLTHCRAESCANGIKADSSFQWVGGCVAACDQAFMLTRVGDPVVIQGVGVEACRRVLVTDGPTTASQSVQLIGVRYEADQLHPDGDAILLRHAGVLSVLGGRYGGGKQRVPRIALAGVGTQSVIVQGATFGSYGAHRTCPVRVNPGVKPRVQWGLNTFQRAEGDAVNTHHQLSWSL